MKNCQAAKSIGPTRRAYDSATQSSSSLLLCFCYCSPLVVAVVAGRVVVFIGSYWAAVATYDVGGR